MLKLWGRENSLNVQKVVWCLEEIGIAYQREDAGMAFGVVGTPEYAAKNPNQLVPVLEDGDFVLWESNVIVRYLARQYAKGTLDPDDPMKHADADRWMDWQQTSFNPAFSPIFMTLIRTPPEARDLSGIDAQIAKAEAYAQILDRKLEGRRYIMGDAFTMADIALGVSVHRWLTLPIKRQSRPHLETYYQTLKARPATRDVFLPLT